MSDDVKRPGELEVIAQQIEGWLEWDKEQRDREALPTNGDTHIMALPVPFWPTHGQFRNWIAALRRPSTPAAGEVEAVKAAILRVGIPGGSTFDAEERADMAQEWAEAAIDALLARTTEGAASPSGLVGLRADGESAIVSGLE